MQQSNMLGDVDDTMSIGQMIIQKKMSRNDTYDHRSVKTGHPVRSAIPVSYTHLTLPTIYSV